MKKAELEKAKGKKIVGGGFGGGNERYGKASTEPMDRREQRERDREQGLVPFAVKLKSDLAMELHALAQKRGESLSDIVAELIQKGLKPK